MTNFFTQEHSTSTPSWDQKMSTIATERLESTAVTSVMTTGCFNVTPNDTDMDMEPMEDMKKYHTPLLVIYLVVFLCGTVTLSLMVHMMRSHTMSTMSISVLNLIFAHFLFILTVPYRIYYYASGHWDMGLVWCKVVSSMIHIHMYMSFIFYVIILSSRLYKFHYNRDVRTQRLLLILVSAFVWVIVLVLVPCTVFWLYGKNKDTHESSTTCFDFGKSIESAMGFNYFVSVVIIVVATVLTVSQANILRMLYKKDGPGCTSQNDFWAQFKSLCIALIMLVCFVPYHIFRLNYLDHLDQLEGQNELFLSLTTFNCLDMLTLLRRRNCSLCFRGNNA